MYCQLFLSFATYIKISSHCVHYKQELSSSWDCDGRPWPQ